MSKKNIQLLQRLGHSQGILLSAFASVAQRSEKLTETVLKVPRFIIVACIFVILTGPTVLVRYNSIINMSCRADITESEMHNQRH
jgi:hypothetical protein